MRSESSLSLYKLSDCFWPAPACHDRQRSAINGLSMRLQNEGYSDRLLIDIENTVPSTSVSSVGDSLSNGVSKLKSWLNWLGKVVSGVPYYAP